MHNQKSRKDKLRNYFEVYKPFVFQAIVGFPIVRYDCGSICNPFFDHWQKSFAATIKNINQRLYSEKIIN
jgi:hypothetical protein